jgi:murein DD-endopeptidase MepM/ murein hydrolase activator NlpD
MKKIQKNFFLTFLSITCFACVFFLSSISYANDDLEDTFEDLEKVTKKIEKTQDIISLKQKEQEIINAQISQIASETAKIKQNIEETVEEIEQLSSDIDRVKREITQKEGHIVLQKKILEKFLREKYQNYTVENAHFTLLNIANANSNTHKESLGHASKGIGDFVQKIHAEQEELKKDQEKLEKKHQRIEDAKYELEQRSNHLESSQNYKRVLAAEAAAEKTKYEEKLSDLLKEQLAIQQEISSLSNDQVGSFSMADLPSAKKADFDMPVKKPYVKTQSYGKTTFSHNYSTGTHNGVDYVAQDSQSILAVADGKVKAVGDMGRYGYGKWVVIDHDNGLMTLYGHMSSVKVSRGDKLDKGDKIGVQGNTGFSTGTHLHFTVFAASTFAIVESSSVDGVYIPTGATVNPESYL